MELLEQFRARSTRILWWSMNTAWCRADDAMDMLEYHRRVSRPAPPGRIRATRRDYGSWLIDGLMPVSELKARLASGLPEEDRGRYNTVAGLLQLVSVIYRPSPALAGCLKSSISMASGLTRCDPTTKGFARNT
jgi:putative hemolysin